MSEFTDTVAQYKRLTEKYNDLDKRGGFAEPKDEGATVQQYNKALIDSVASGARPGLQAALDEIRLEINVDDLHLGPQEP